jgi:ABC-type branched-subunit amino acid transport system substrate-binding protein
MNTSLRSRNNIKRAAAAAGLGLALGLAACGGGSGSGHGPGSKPLNLVIGNSLPLSGVSMTLGESGQKASDLAVTQIKRAISETGSHHTVNTLNEDQGSTTDSAVQSARTLVNDDKASCLTGPWSAETVAKTAEDVAIPAKVLQISPVPVDDDVAELSDHDLINSTALPQSVEGSAISDAISKDLGGTQGHEVNVAANHGAYGDTVSQDFVKSWQGDDGTVGEQVTLSPPPLSAPSTGGSSTTTGYGSAGNTGSSSSSSSVYSGQVYQLLSGNPDAVVIVDDPNGFAALAPALQAQSSWDPTTAWGGDQLVSPGLPDQVGADAINGFRALAPGTPDDEEASSAFIQAFESADPHAVKLATYAAQQFDATVLCYLAAVAAGSTDGQKMADELVDITAPGGDEFSWQQLPDAIKALEDGKDIDYTGASGPIDMDVHGDPTAGVFDVYRYTPNGDMKVSGEVSVSKPNPATP